MADDASDGMLSQEDIDAAMAAAGGEADAPGVDAPAPSPRSEAEADEAAVEGGEAPEISAGDATEVNTGTPGAGQEPAAVIPQPAAPAPAESKPFDIPDLLQEVAAESGHQHGIDLLRDVELDVKIELGRSRMLVEDVLRLGEGSVVELDKLAGDPVDVLVNGRLVARGEVLVLNDTFCVRVNDIFSTDPMEGDEDE